MFRFTIRELVLVTLVVAMGVGWWLDHRRLSAINRLLHTTTEIAVADANDAMHRLEHSSRTFRELVDRLRSKRDVTEFQTPSFDER